jgi:hypothetical protein
VSDFILPFIHLPRRLFSLILATIVPCPR